MRSHDRYLRLTARFFEAFPQATHSAEQGPQVLAVFGDGAAADKARRSKKAKAKPQKKKQKKKTPTKTKGEDSGDEKPVAVSEAERASLQARMDRMGGWRAETRVRQSGTGIDRYWFAPPSEHMKRCRSWAEVKAALDAIDAARRRRVRDARRALRLAERYAAAERHLAAQVAESQRVLLQARMDAQADTRVRQSGKGTDRYWFPPGEHKRCRSWAEVERTLDAIES